MKGGKLHKITVFILYTSMINGQSTISKVSYFPTQLLHAEQREVFPHNMYTLFNNSECSN